MAPDVPDRASRCARSLFSLNRGREFSSLCTMLELETLPGSAENYRVLANDFTFANRLNWYVVLDC